MNNKYYLWINPHDDHWQASGNLHGYDSEEKLRNDPGNKITMKIYSYCIMKAVPISITYNCITKDNIPGEEVSNYE